MRPFPTSDVILPASFFGFLFPQRCPVCNRDAHASRAVPICTVCWESIQPYNGHACRQCGLPTSSAHTDLCQTCLVDPPPFTRALSYGIYEGVLKEAIHLLKFNKHRRLAKPLAELLAALNLAGADALIPVPVHLNQLRQREFNQTALIAKHLGKLIRIPLMIDGLKKMKDTAAQIDVDRKERLRNLRKAFAASDAVRGKRIILVDDVITTGATVRECAQTLTKAGAAEVIVVALARSMPKQ